MKKLLIVLIPILIFISGVGVGFGIGGIERKQIDCYFEVINPDTGEVLPKNEDMYLAYDGSTKGLIFIARRVDNNKQIDIESYDLHMTYTNLETGEVKRFVSTICERGRYWVQPDNYKYNKEKYSIIRPSPLIVYVE